MVDWEAIKASAESDQAQTPNDKLSIPELDTVQNAPTAQNASVPTAATVQSSDLSIPELDSAAPQQAAEGTSSNQQPGEAQLDDDPGILGTLQDAAHGLLHGTTKFIQETGSTIHAMAGGDNQYSLMFDQSTPETKAEFDKGFQIIPGLVSIGQSSHAGQILNSGDVAKPTTEAGGIVSSITQQVEGFVLASRLLGKFGVPGGAAKNVASSGLGDFFSIDAHQKRLSNFIHDSAVGNLPLAGAITDFLSAKDDDPILLAKLKAGIEGAGLVAAGEKIFAMLKHAKRIPDLFAKGGAEAVAHDAVKTANSIDLLDKYEKAFMAHGQAEADLAASQGEGLLNQSKREFLNSKLPGLQAERDAAEKAWKDSILDENGLKEAPNSRVSQTLTDEQRTFNQLMGELESREANYKQAKTDWGDFDPQTQAYKKALQETKNAIKEAGLKEKDLRAAFRMNRESQGTINVVDEADEIGAKRAQKNGNPTYYSKKPDIADDIEGFKLRSDAEVMDEMFGKRVSKTGGTDAPEAISEEALNLYKAHLEKNLKDGVAGGKPPEVPINLDRIVNSGKAREALDAMMKVADDVGMQFKAKQPESWAKLEAKAENNFKSEIIDAVEDSGKSPQELLTHLLNESQGDIVKARLRMQTGRDLMTMGLNRIVQIAQKAKHAPSAQDDALFDAYANFVSQVSEATYGVLSEAARTTRAGANHVDGTDTVNAIRTYFGNGEVDRDTMYQAIRMANNPWSVEKLRKLTGSALQEYLYNSILSGPKTNAANALSNTLMYLDSVASKTVGGALTGNKQVMREGIDTFLSLKNHLWSSAKMAGKAAWNEDPILRGGAATKFEASTSHRAISSEAIRDQLEALGIDADTSWLARGINATGKTVRLPSAVLGGSDEFALQISYRTIGYAKALGEGRAQGLSGKALAEYATERFTQLMDETGAATDQHVLDQAVRNTFTTDLSKDTLTRAIGYHVQSATETFPLLRVITPFTRIATNLAQETVDHSLLTFTQGRTWDAIKAGGEERALVAGRLAMGSLYAGVATSLAAQGRLTGRAPADPEAAKAFAKTGRQPYSIAIPRGDGKVEWVSYKRIEPFASLLGMAADSANIFGHLDEMDSAELATSISQSFAQNLSYKTYLQSLSELMSAMTEESDGDTAAQKLQKWVDSRATAFIPFSGLVNSLKNDQTIREGRDITEKFMRRIPGYSQHVDPDVNLWGDHTVAPVGFTGIEVNPVLDAVASWGSPFESTTTKEDAAQKEVYRLINEDGLRMTPLSDKWMGTQLDLKQFKNTQGQSAGYFLRRAASYIKLPDLTWQGNPDDAPLLTLREQINKYVQSDLYKDETTDNTTVRYEHGINHYKGTKADQIRSIKTAYDKMAYNELWNHRDEFKGPGKWGKLGDAMVQVQMNTGLALLTEEQKKDAGLTGKDGSPLKIDPVPSKGTGLPALQGLAPPQ